MDPDQPRVPAGSGRTSGQWTSGDSGTGSGGGAAASPARTVAVVPGAASALAGAGTLAEGLFGAAGSEFLAGLGALALTLGGAGAVLGAIFVPSPNPGVTSEGEVPGDHGLRYALNNDEGTLRLTNEDGEIVAAASLGQGGIYYDTKTGTPVARAIGGSVVIDAQALENRAVPKETADAAAEDARAARAAARDDNSPRLCPDPEPDVRHGASDRATAYQAQISRLNTPQAPLRPGVAVSLMNPVTEKPVVDDDCRESDGTMIEAKGPGLAKLLEFSKTAENLRAEWIDQATRQVQASAGRAIEWYFSEDEAAAEAELLFANDGRLTGKIKILIEPALVH